MTVVLSHKNRDLGFGTIPAFRDGQGRSNKTLKQKGDEARQQVAGSQCEREVTQDVQEYRSHGSGSCRYIGVWGIWSRGCGICNHSPTGTDRVHNSRVMAAG